MNVSLWVGSIGFLCYYVYDICSVKRPESVAKYLFRIGSIFVLLSLIYEVYTKASHMDVQTISFFVYLCLSVLFWGALVYTLFFCFDVKETYLETNQKRMAYTEGMYALCRHPGVLWFAGGFLSLYGMTGSKETLWYALAMIGYNLIYIVLQDWYVFPRTFLNYRSYQQQTPFLIPNCESIKRCIHTMPKREYK